MKKYDVFVIGAGPGGYSSAIQIRDLGFSVAIAEVDLVGGTCLNYGCIPTKFLLQKAKEIKIRKAEMSDNILCEWNKEKESMLLAMRNNMESTLRNKGIELYRGAATIRKEDGLIIQIGQQEYKAEKIVLATGSIQQIPPIKGVMEGVNSGFVFGSKQMLSNNDWINRLVIIGGGIIGFEFASFWNMLGCEVTVLEKTERVLPQLDEDVRKQYVRTMEKKGIIIHTEVDVQEIDDDEQCVVYTHNQQHKMAECDKVLLATGRKAVLHHNIKEEECTSQENVYLVGDCNGKMALAHAAYEEAKVLSNSLQGIEDSVCYDLIPGIIYSNPELAWVGKTELCCYQEGIKCKCYKKSMSYSGKYFIENRTEQGMCKLVFNAENQKILGAQLIGNGSSELISFLKLAIQKEMTRDELRRFTYPHPSIAEIIYETIE